MSRALSRNEGPSPTAKTTSKKTSMSNSEINHQGETQRKHKYQKREVANQPRHSSNNKRIETTKQPNRIRNITEETTGLKEE
jgi:hypothetical protein